MRQSRSTSFTLNGMSTCSYLQHNKGGVFCIHIWSKNQANIDRVLKNTTAGGTCINHTVVQFLHGNLPFGGVNNSGIGSGHGIYGFKAFSHERAVVRTRIMGARLFFPPFTPFTLKIIGMIKKLAKILA